MHEHTYLPSRSARATGGAQLRDAFLGSLSRRIVGRAAGTTLPAGVRLSDEPKQRLWLGMLSSEPEIRQQGADRQAFRTKVTPPAQGFAFRASNLPARLDVTLTFTIYVSLHPTLAEQRREATTADGKPDSPANRPAPGGGTGYKLAPVWQKVQVGPIDLAVPVEIGVRRPSALEQAIADAARAAVAAIPRERLFRPRRTSNPAGSLPRDFDLADEAAWSSYCSANLLAPGAALPPEHRAAIHLEASRSGDGFEFLLLVVNTTPPEDHQFASADQPFESGHLETRIYEVELAAVCPSPVVPHDLEQVAHSYRYSRDVPALGHACPVQVLPGRGGTTVLRTRFAAEEPTDRVHPRLTAAGPGGAEIPIDTTFDAMIANPVGATGRIADLLEAWVDREWSGDALSRLGEQAGWGPEARKEAEQDAEAARAEVAWIRAGIAVLRDDERARAAFIAANRSMKAAARGRYESWRPFQIAWIVGCLPGLVDPAAHPEVAIVAFSTGGGKSEAYLGLMLVTLFHGRYLGLTAGCQVWARFPLRLLALQQAERFAAAIFHAEMVRRDIPEIADGGPFGLGYFVGSTNTPNKLFRPEPGNRYHVGAPNPDDPRIVEMCRVLERCPVCEGPDRIVVRFDDKSSTMQHICDNQRCPMTGPLPVWSVDDAIYRNAPSVLVGTVDKLALLGTTQQFQVVLGRAHSRCPSHGYTANPDFCAVFGCKEQRRPVGQRFGGLRLEIADELHLLEESLGALDGMYETLLHAINQRFKNPPFQIVGATATIEGYERQVDHLYKRPARRFPANGPRVGENFWAVTVPGDPLRRYVGVRPRAGTMVTATREVAVTHAEWVGDLLSAPAAVAAEAGLDASDPRIVELARQLGEDHYEVLVAYCLRIEDLTSFTRDDRVRDLLPSQESLVVINSDAGSREIQSAVRRLVEPPDDPAERVKIVAATKAIGHGFDVARLGVMAVMGTPNQAAEIIQASARVGRTHPGLVVNVINPTRDRDASVYRYYAEWIRYLDRLVHKVPVNRESLPVLKRVLPGGLMAWALQAYDRGWTTGARGRKSLAKSGEFRRAVESGYLDRNSLIRDLAEGFGIDPRSVYHKMHRDAIVAWVDDHLTTVGLRADGETRLSELLHPSVPTSLRDVEEPITIYGQI
jgi:hypothetical protein